MSSRLSLKPVCREGVGPDHPETSFHLDILELYSWGEFPILQRIPAFSSSFP